MHRKIVYRGQLPYETDFLYAQRFTMEALGLLAADLLGMATLVSGCGCAPTSPASMSVQIAPGRIYSQQDLDDTAYGVVNNTGGLPLDNSADHRIVKQGLLRDTTVLAAFTAPGTVGQSVNYLIQAAFSEVDADPVVLPFFNADQPDVPWAGPGNSGGQVNTTRKNSLVITTKQGIAAATGTQITPAPDAGCVGLWVVTVDNGATSIASGKITAYSGAPFLSETLVQKISQTFADNRYLQIANARIRLTANTTFYVNASSGNDATGNGSAGAPWASLQNAWNVLQTRYDLAGFVATIQLADGAYAGAVMQGSLLGASKGVASLIVNGNASNPGNVTVTSTIYVSDFAEVTFRNFKRTGANTGFQCSTYASIAIDTGMIFATTAGIALYASGGGIAVTASITVSGGGQAFMLSLGGLSNFYLAGGITITFTGTPIYSVAVFNIGEMSTVHFAGTVTFTGAITGTSYIVDGNSLIYLAGNSIPGSAGVQSNGGRAY